MVVLVGSLLGDPTNDADLDGSSVPLSGPCLIDNPKPPFRAAEHSVLDPVMSITAMPTRPYEGSDSTPPQEDNQKSMYASYVPHDLKYSADFEDALMNVVTDPDTPIAGIRVIPAGSDEEPQAGISIRAEDISFSSLPSVSENELPLPLDDARRVFASPVPGVKLTHPGGYLEGGPGLNPEMDTFPDDFIQNYPVRISNASDLKNAVEAEVERNLDLLQQRLKARRQAKERNEQIEKELKTLMDQHEMELKMHNRIAEENARKKEARERRRKDRAGA
ncbi:hypothetical protein M433DRAFT_541139 [Acidomyces richmondensis BFW]|nr:MAG: hypothetical protein FE78DRAFT_68534 [Acidomyces sp. 'richmondensis']KYG44231.1 hypothetical protein M433DRAFT_541139 [Acidomyces richmondensis BFW]